MSLKNTNVTNRTLTRAFYLECAKKLKPFHKFERVADEELEEAERHLRGWIAARIARLPSKGQTIKL